MSSHPPVVYTMPTVDALLAQYAEPAAAARLVANDYRELHDAALRVAARVSARSPGLAKHGHALAILAGTVDRMGARAVGAVLGVQAERTEGDAR